MAADTDDALYEWSTTESNNKPAGATTVGTNWDDNLRMIQKVTRGWLASKGADIASAGTTDLGAIEGLSHDITGTTPITGFGTVSAGIWKIIKFEGALTLTHNAVSLIIPGGASIVTADGDMLMATSEGSGNWRVNWYVKSNGSPLPFIDSDAIVHGSADVTKKVRIEADGITTATTRVITMPDGDVDLTPLSGTQTANKVFAGPTSGAAATPAFRALVGAESALVLLATKTASASASLSFSSSDFDWTLYDEYEFRFRQIIPATDNLNIQSRISEDGGSTWKQGAGSYTSLQVEATAVPGGPTASTQNTTLWNLNNLGLSNSSDYGLNGKIKMFKPSSTIKKEVLWEFVLPTPTSSLTRNYGAGQYSGDAGAWNGIQFFMASGNITSGEIRAYGIRKA